MGTIVKDLSNWQRQKTPEGIPITLENRAYRGKRRIPKSHHDRARKSIKVLLHGRQRTCNNKSTTSLHDKLNDSQESENEPSIRHVNKK